MVKISSLTVIISAIGVMAAIIFQSIQIIRSIKAQKMQQEMMRAQVLMNFSTRFFEIVKNGSLYSKIEDEQWAYQYWSLLSTEFYFFHNRIIPAMVYAFWMTDLSKLYTKFSKVRQMHVDYLHTYSYNYGDMVAFYDDIYNISLQPGDQTTKDKSIFEFVKKWQQKNKPSKY